MRAADELAKAGKKAGVIDAYSMPLQTKGILEIAQKSGGRIITVEDNYSGGLDAEIGIAIAQSRRVNQAAESVRPSGSQERPRAAGRARLPRAGRHSRSPRRCSNRSSSSHRVRSSFKKGT